MIDALWSVQFGVPSQHSYGAGIVVFSNGKIYGGDTSYYYIGSYTQSGEDVTAILKIKHHAGALNNVLGHGIKEADLKLSGKYAEQRFTVTDGTFMATLLRLEEL